jgi:DNA-binding PadR family transcriptional regulator
MLAKEKKKAKEEPEALLPLTPAVLHILLALADGERHGYSIMQEVTAQTEGAIRMGPGTLYGSLKRMLASGLVEELAVRPDPQQEDVRRRYYRLTEYGQRLLRAELARLTCVVQLPAARKVLRDLGIAAPGEGI